MRNKSKNFYDHKVMGMSSANNPGFDRNSVKVVEWFPSDTEALFRENIDIPERRKELIKYGWAHPRTLEPTQILYTINEYGFRGQSFDNVSEGCAMFLGCSNMFGIGIFEKDTIPRKFTAITGIESVNLGQPGGSLDAAVRVAMHWVPILKPRIIFLLHPPGIRRELFVEQMYDPNHGAQIGERWIQFGLNNLRKRDGLDGDREVFSKYFTQPHEELVNRAKNLYALMGLSTEYSSIFIEATPQDCPKDIASRTMARDLGHYGPAFSSWFAQYFKQILITREGEMCKNEE